MALGLSPPTQFARKEQKRKIEEFRKKKVRKGQFQLSDFLAHSFHEDGLDISSIYLIFIARYKTIAIENPDCDQFLDLDPQP